mgnify:CR=1 FL=1
MNKLTKVGLTALATTLVSSASFAGEMSVSGSAALSYTGLNTNSDVNPFAMGDSVKFNGGGDLDNGMTVSVYYELDGGTYDDYNLKLGMGDAGTLSFSGASSSGSGVDKLKDIVPNAYSPVYEATDATDSGLIDASGNNQAGQWGYDYTLDNITLSASYNPNSQLQLHRVFLPLGSEFFYFLALVRFLVATNYMYLQIHSRGESLLVH